MVCHFLPGCTLFLTLATPLRTFAFARGGNGPASAGCGELPRTRETRLRAACTPAPAVPVQLVNRSIHVRKAFPLRPQVEVRAQAVPPRVRSVRGPFSAGDVQLVSERGWQLP